MVKRKQPKKSGGRGRRSARDRGAQWLYGLHTVAAALGNPKRRCHRLLATKEAASTLAARLRAEASQPNHEPIIVSKPDLEANLPPGAVHQGVGLLVEPLPAPSLKAILDAPGPAVLVALDQVTDPQNLGAILRSCAAFGATGVIVPERHGVGQTSALAKAASGALETVPLIRVTNLSRSLATTKDRGFWCIGLAATAERPLGGLDPGDRVVLVLGAEGSGLRRLTSETCDYMVSIPIRTEIGSLNVSTAAAIALYELLGRGDGTSG